MAKLFFLIIFFSFFENKLYALSSIRDPKTSYLDYLKKYQIMGDSKNITPLSVARFFDISKLPRVTKWNSTELLRQNFYKMRDTRFLKWKMRSNFPRRSSWLYPDDGCFARATLANKNFHLWRQPVPNKVFVFGNLKVKTQNNPKGIVTWWYHVALIVELKNIFYVLDPAIDPKAPLTLNRWLESMGNPSKMRVAICASGTYAPNSRCNRSINGKESDFSQQKYLDLEWNRLKILRRNPSRELGAYPPWL